MALQSFKRVSGGRGVGGWVLFVEVDAFGRKIPPCRVLSLLHPCLPPPSHTHTHLPCPSTPLRVSCLFTTTTHAHLSHAPFNVRAACPILLILFSSSSCSFNLSLSILSYAIPTCSPQRTSFAVNISPRARNTRNPIFQRRAMQDEAPFFCRCVCVLLVCVCVCVCVCCVCVYMCVYVCACVSKCTCVRAICMSRVSHVRVCGSYACVYVCVVCASFVVCVGWYSVERDPACSLPGS